MGRRATASKAIVERPRTGDPIVEPVKRRVEIQPSAIERTIHEPLRLMIVSALAANERLTFNELKDLLRTTDGNLSVHARKLEEAEYIVCEKKFKGRIPRSEYRLTAAGRRALDKYVAHMEAILKAVKT